MQTNIHFPSASQLTEYVTGIWEVSGNRNVEETILPKGIVEMIFNLGDPMTGLLPNEMAAVQTPLCFIQGVNTKNVKASYVGSQHLFGIRLQPGMVKSLLGVLPFEFKNTVVDLTLIKPAFLRLWHQLKDCKTFAERVVTIENEFPILSTDVCARTKKLCDLFLADGIQEFQSLDNLTKQVYYSSRHLNRKVQNIFGLSAEELITYKKFLESVKLVHKHAGSLTSIAYESGFFDQAHFCKIFKSYTGLTALQYRKAKSDLPFHIFSSAS